MTNIKQFDLLASLPKESLKEVTYTDLQSAFDHTKIENGIEFEVNKTGLTQPESATPQNTFTQDFTGEEPQPEPKKEEGPANLNIGEVIDPKQAVEILDIIAVSVLSIGFKFAKIKASKAELKATAAEKSTIEPILKKVLDSMNLKFDNPLNALMVTLAIVYGTKGAEIFVNEKLNKKEEDKNSAPDDLGFFVSSPKKGRGRPKKS